MYNGNNPSPNSTNLTLPRSLGSLIFNGVSENAKWFLNVSWQMEGVDIHLDVSVGKQLSALGHTLTMLTGTGTAQQTMSYIGLSNFWCPF